LPRPTQAAASEKEFFTTISAPVEGVSASAVPASSEPAPAGADEETQPVNELKLYGEVFQGAFWAASAPLARSREPA
jgi:hypothetical protein